MAIRLYPRLTFPARSFTRISWCSRRTENNTTTSNTTTSPPFWLSDVRVLWGSATISLIVKQKFQRRCSFGHCNRNFLTPVFVVFIISYLEKQRALIMRRIMMWIWNVNFLLHSLRFHHLFFRWRCLFTTSRCFLLASCLHNIVNS